MGISRETATSTVSVQWQEQGSRSCTTVCVCACVCACVGICVCKSSRPARTRAPLCLSRACLRRCGLRACLRPASLHASHLLLDDRKPRGDPPAKKAPQKAAPRRGKRRRAASGTPHVGLRHARERLQRESAHLPVEALQVGVHCCVCIHTFFSMHRIATQIAIDQSKFAHKQRGATDKKERERKKSLETGGGHPRTRRTRPCRPGAFGDRRLKCTPL